MFSIKQHYMQIAFEYKWKKFKFLDTFLLTIKFYSGFLSHSPCMNSNTL